MDELCESLSNHGIPISPRLRDEQTFQRPIEDSRVVIDLGRNESDG